MISPSDRPSAPGWCLLPPLLGAVKPPGPRLSGRGPSRGASPPRNWVFAGRSPVKSGILCTCVCVRIHLCIYLFIYLFEIYLFILRFLCNNIIKWKNLLSVSLWLWRRETFIGKSKINKITKKKQTKKTNKKKQTKKTNKKTKQKQ